MVTVISTAALAPISRPLPLDLSLLIELWRAERCLIVSIRAAEGSLKLCRTGRGEAAIRELTLSDVRGVFCHVGFVV